jgi:cobalt-zinc-cadmium efflux system membrane fusion protein
MSLQRIPWRAFLGIALVLIISGGAYLTRSQWLSSTPTKTDDEHVETGPPSEKVLLSEQAQKNLRLTSKPLVATNHWKTLSVPGMVIDRPGHSDRGITTPVTAAITRIHHVAGEIVKPGDVLFTLKLLSEPLQLTQQDLFKSTLDLQFAQTQKKQFALAGDDIPKATRIELDNRITRLEVSVRAFRQELLNRGLNEKQVNDVGEGKYVTEIPIAVPARSPEPKSANEPTTPLYEIQELKVELGQQAQAGQTLCLLANHQLLAIEGRAFRDEAPLLERAVKEGWAVDVDFGEQANADWPTLPKAYPISHIANTIDPENRTFRFLMPLENQYHIIEKEGRQQLLWRFRPGQRIRLLVRVEELKNVFVLPLDAVAREGADAYVFRQNGDLFERKPVHVLYQDRQFVAVANDGSVPPNVYIAQTGATQLNRLIKSAGNTLPKGFHIHADGSVHMGGH